MHGNGVFDSFESFEYVYYTQFMGTLLHSERHFFTEYKMSFKLLIIVRLSNEMCVGMSELLVAIETNGIIVL